jgi:tripartite-type tricarboxylate transporter receptor subunit TctC
MKVYLAPAKTPRPIVVKLNQTSVNIVRSPEIVERLAAIGNDPVGSRPEEFDKLIQEGIPKWAKVIRAAGITLTQ